MVKMPDVAALSSSDYPNIEVTQLDSEYWEDQQPSELIWALLCLQIIRKFEQSLIRPEIEELVHGPVHSSIGQEAVAVGAAMALTSDDKITSTHRAHHHFLAKAIAHYSAPSANLLSQPPSESLKQCVAKTMAEIMGLRKGWIGGRGGSMHLFDDASGNIGTQAIVAGNIPYTSGIAFAEKSRKTGNVALAYLGDGAVSIGPFHEGVCIAKVYNLPAIFVVENNLYGVATHAREATGLDDLVIRSAGYNIPGLIVDGMNPLAVRRGVALAKQHAAAGNGPVLIEAKTYRYFHQSGRIPGSAFGYRTKDEEAQWASRDPLKTWPTELIERGILDQGAADRLAELADEVVAFALDQCTVEEAGAPAIRPEMQPEPAVARLHVRSDETEFAGARYASLDDCDQTKEVKLVRAISGVIARHMETNPEVFTAGEDVANLKGGAYGATKDALAKFPERVLNAPIAEGGIVGLGHGAAVAGMRPIMEIMFCDFSLIAADELYNQVASCRYMYNGRVDVPLVVRSRCSTGRGFGAQHSGDTVGLFAMFPGWRIVAPTTPFDYIGLFNAAMQSLDPVFVVEHHELYMAAGPIPEDDLDYLVPLGKAAVRRHGSDVTVLAYLSMVPRVMRIAEELAQHEGLDLEVIDLRTLDYANIDYDTISQSLAKTGRAVIVEQAPQTQCLGPFIAAELQKHLQDMLPIRLVSSMPTPIPVSKVQETAVLIDDEQIRNDILKSVDVAAQR